MSARSVLRWRPRLEWLALWLEEQSQDGSGVKPWGQYVGIAIDSRWRWGMTHEYCNGPHDQFSLGSLHFCWSLYDCEKCAAAEVGEDQVGERS